MDNTMLNIIDIGKLNKENVCAMLKNLEKEIADGKFTKFDSQELCRNEFVQYSGKEPNEEFTEKLSFHLMGVFSKPRDDIFLKFQKLIKTNISFRL